MLYLYFLVGIVWTAYVFNKRKTLKVSQQDHWFTVMLFSFLLWPFFLYFAYERGMLKEFKLKQLTNK